MIVKIVPDITTIEQCASALVAAVCQPFTAANCSHIADLHRTRARLWRELVKTSPMIRHEFQAAAHECAERDLVKATEWDRRAADGRK